MSFVPFEYFEVVNVSIHAVQIYELKYKPLQNIKIISYKRITFSTFITLKIFHLSLHIVFQGLIKPFYIFKHSAKNMKALMKEMCSFVYILHSLLFSFKFLLISYLNHVFTLLCPKTISKKMF